MTMSRLILIDAFDYNTTKRSESDTKFGHSLFSSSVLKKKETLVDEDFVQISFVSFKHQMMTKLFFLQFLPTKTFAPQGLFYKDIRNLLFVIHSLFFCCSSLHGKDPPACVCVWITFRTINGFLSYVQRERVGCKTNSLKLSCFSTRPLIRNRFTPFLSICPPFFVCVARRSRSLPAEIFSKKRKEK